MNRFSTILLSISLAAGLVGLGLLLRDGILGYRAMERSVTVKGLAEQEFEADVVIWPIRFSVAENALGRVYETLQGHDEAIRNYLLDRGLDASEITSSAPIIVDKLAQAWDASSQPEFRYTATQIVTVYSSRIDDVRQAMATIADLGREGIVLGGNEYQAPVDYLFTRLNEIKPDMIEQATVEARRVAEKFAADSDSTLGKIRTASQGQFSIEPRDSNNPHIQRVRVVSTVQYYLID